MADMMDDMKAVHEDQMKAILAKKRREIELIGGLIVVMRDVFEQVETHDLIRLIDETMQKLAAEQMALANFLRLVERDR